MIAFLKYKLVNREIKKYCNEVLNKKIEACEWERLTIERHLTDLETANENGLYFDEKAGLKAIQFSKFCKQSKGVFRGKPLNLSPFQKFKIYCLFGWKRENGYRRFTKSYNEIARKNGKSTEAAFIGLYMLIADKEGGAEIYSAATKRDQALIVFNEAKNMCSQSSDFLRILELTNNNIAFPSMYSKFEPLSADYKKGSGLNAHCAIIDELHEHKTSGVVDLLETSMGARIQPLLYEITTAGFSRETVCFEHRKYTEDVLKGVITDNSWFGSIFTLDKDDDWQDETLWRKANPNLGVSKRIEYMRENCLKAKNLPSYENTFKRFDLNIWTSNETRWLSDDDWMNCGSDFTEEYLQGRKCYGGLDLASKKDFAAFTLTFPIGDELFTLTWFWLPEAAVKNRTENKSVPYEDWQRNSFLKVTPGNIIDYEIIIYDILNIGAKFDVSVVGYDAWNSSHVAVKLNEAGVKVHEFSQYISSMGPPTKELEALILGAKLKHNNNPIMRWMMGNIFIITDSNENFKIDKSKSEDKVDGPVSLVMSVGEWLTEKMQGDGRSKYEQSGPFML